MKPAARQAGYALLAAVVVTALAAVFAAAAVAAVSAGLEVAAGDAAGALVSRAADEGLEWASAELRRRPDGLPWTASSPEPARGVEWSIACAAVEQPESTSCVRADVVALAWSAAARRRVHAIAELRPVAWAQGLTVGGDVRLRAPLVVSGGGLYSGGSVAGCEYVTFVDPVAAGTAPPRDHVRGEDWPLAAVHALGGVWAQGVEVHDDPEWSGPDTDVHTGSGRVGELAQPPSSVEKTLLLQTADLRLEPGEDRRVDLSVLPAAAPSGAAGLVVVVADPGRPVTVVGERAAAAGPLVLVVEGDAVLGVDETPLRLRGALVSFGSLAVAAPTELDGHLWARSLTVDAPMRVTTSMDWRRHPLPCLVDVVLVALGR